ncbi:XRE family transcriptional regulator [Amycolatopsis sp. H20-H5]|uniref:XRE family transcriptional regulator n=1 Tax=Amycolatopsis sp. H20-H5 TaxID=3046309 RepID=UPI002DBCDA53|nr:XRE family transcriptional regulator [Amycolatopsis sp. H20-H5]MEC3979294.1 XRE family transcriptional regulator [Amycolatopsis sp. H20-H5]
MSRGELADAVNEYLWHTRRKRFELDGHSVARYERGQVRWPNEPYRAGLRAVLGVDSDAKLGFSANRRGSTGPLTGPVKTVTTGGLKATADLGTTPTEFLRRITLETPVPARVGQTEVDHVRATTSAIAMSENLFGGGLSCEAAMGQLRWAGKLLESRAADNVRNALLEAVGNLGGVVAYSAFDIADHRAADHCFEFALWCSEQGGSWGLRADTLAGMARKATYLGNFEEALTLIELSQVRADRLTSTARAMLGTVRARLLGLTGRNREALDEASRADDHFAERSNDENPPWLVYYDEAEHQGSIGKALIPIAKDEGKPELASSRLEAAIRLHDARYPRSRVFSQIRLASLLMVTDDPRQAAMIGRNAVTGAAPLNSARVIAELDDLKRVAEPHKSIGDVTDLCDGIAAMARPAGP